MMLHAAAQGSRNIEVISNCAVAEIWLMTRTPSIPVMGRQRMDRQHVPPARCVTAASLSSFVQNSQVPRGRRICDATWLGKPCIAEV